MAVKGNGEVPPHKHLVKIEIAHGDREEMVRLFHGTGYFMPIRPLLSEIGPLKVLVAVEPDNLVDFLNVLHSFRGQIVEFTWLGFLGGTTDQCKSTDTFEDFPADGLWLHQDYDENGKFLGLHSKPWK